MPDDNRGGNPRQRPVAVALISGGLDSCVSAAVAALDYDLAFLHVSYGQLTETREMQAFTAIAEHYGVEHRLSCQLPHLRQIGGTSLIATEPGNPLSSVASSARQDPGDGKRRDLDVPDTYVPFRNASLLAVAVAWAETVGASAVFIGAHQTDSPYPDCTAEFFAAFNGAVAAGTANAQIRICTPLLHLDKVAIVVRGAELNAPLHLTWSCYVNGNQACGVCHSCQLRRRGFAEAGVPDRIPYA